MHCDIVGKLRQINLHRAGLHRYRLALHNTNNRINNLCLVLSINKRKSIKLKHLGLVFNILFSCR